MATPDNPMPRRPDEDTGRCRRGMFESRELALMVVYAVILIVVVIALVHFQRGVGEAKPRRINVVIENVPAERGDPGQEPVRLPVANNAEKSDQKTGETPRVASDPTP